MATADYSSFHQPSGTGADGTKLDNFIDAVQATVNSLDNNNLAAAAGILPSKIGQAGATTGQALEWNGTAWAPATISSPKIITGRVSAADAILGGTGFTMSKVGTGNYLVTFTVAFAAVPLVIAIPADSGGPIMTAQIGNAGTGSVQILISVSSTGALTDCAFHFQARDVV